MAEHVPHVFPGDDKTLPVSAAVVGGQLVEVTGTTGTVGPAGANSLKCVGVAGRDAPASGMTTIIYATGVHDLVATGAITAGDQVVCGAAGTVSSLAAVTTPTAADVTNTRAIVGTALESITDTAKGRIELRKL